MMTLSLGGERSLRVPSPLVPSRATQRAPAQCATVRAHLTRLPENLPGEHAASQR
jgi:hypothetical protein